MDEPAAFRSMLGHMSFTYEGNTAMADQHLIDDLYTLISLDDKDIISLCDVIRPPGGSIVNPAYVQVGGIYLVGVNTYIQNNGTPVALVAENNLKLAVFYLKYMNWVSRPVPVSEVTVLNTKTVASLYKFERDYEPKEGAMVIDDKNWIKTLEDMYEFLYQRLGTTLKNPLAYVIRESPEVNPTADDPVTNYDTQEGELITRIPHLTKIGATVYYKADNCVVWHYIYEDTKDKSCFTHCKRFQRAKDGRAAYVVLKHQYLGADHVNQQAPAAEGMLQNMIYTGRNRFTFKHYCTLHIQQHEILRG